MGRPSFNHVRLGGGIPVASQAKMTGLLMVSTTLSSAGPSILGGTEKRGRRYFCIILYYFLKGLKFLNLDLLVIF